MPPDSLIRAPDLWSQIIASNAPEIIAVLDKIGVDLAEIREALAEVSVVPEAELTDAIDPVRRLRAGNDGRRTLPTSMVVPLGSTKSSQSSSMTSPGN